MKLKLTKKFRTFNERYFISHEVFLVSCNNSSFIPHQTAALLVDCNDYMASICHHESFAVSHCWENPRNPGSRKWCAIEQNWLKKLTPLCRLLGVRLPPDGSVSNKYSFFYMRCYAQFCKKRVSRSNDDSRVTARQLVKGVLEKNSTDAYPVQRMADPHTKACILSLMGLRLVATYI